LCTGTGGIGVLVTGVFNALAINRFVQRGGGVSVGVFANAGTFNRDGIGTITFSQSNGGLDFDNTGTVNIDSGDLVLDGGGTNSGTVSVDAGARLRLLQSYTHGAASSLSGAGTIDFVLGTHSFPPGTFTPTGLVNFVGGTITINNGYTASSVVGGATVIFNAVQSIATLELSSGTFTGSGQTTITDGFTWTGGTMSGPGGTIVAAGATATLAGTAARAGPLTLSRTLENDGTVTWIGTGNLNLTSLAVFINDGTFLIDSSATLNGTGVIQNAGTIEKTSGGTTAAAAGLAWSNLGGTIKVGAGLLAINGSFQTPPGSITTVVGPGMLELNGAQNWGTGSRMDITTGGSVNLNSNVGTSDRPEVRILNGTLHINTSQHFGPYRAISRKPRVLAASGPSQAIVAAGANVRVVTDAINLDVPGGAALDLNDGVLIVDYATEDPSPLATIRGYIIAGYNNGAWNGAGIKSTVAAGSAAGRLGYAEAVELGLSSFAGEPIDATTVLVRYTIAGDADLDGDVDVADLGRLASNWQTAAPWSGGDFNYDGAVDVADLGLLASNWQLGFLSAVIVSAPPRDICASLNASAAPNNDVAISETQLVSIGLRNQNHPIV
jgi:hypothetical protein